MGATVVPPIDLSAPIPVPVKPLLSSELEVDHWYLGWRCTSCGFVTTVMADPTCGALRLRLTGRGVVYFNCRCCHSDQVQTPMQCVQYHHAPFGRRLHRVVAQR